MFRFRCNYCPPYTEKTNRLKLKTIQGIDYLLCSLHFWEVVHYGTEESTRKRTYTSEHTEIEEFEVDPKVK